MHTKTFQYRLYPTKAQATIMQQTLDECRWLYNHLLDQRKGVYEQTGKTLGLYDQHKLLPALKRERPALRAVYSQVLQNVGVRLDLAFQAFFRRVKAGETPGFPRFRGAGRYDSFCYPGTGFGVSGQTVVLSKIGAITAIIHRPLEGTAKTCCVRRTSTGKWFVTFVCQHVPDATLPEVPERVGIDVGLTHFATLSDGSTIDNPRFFRTDEKALQTVQRRLSREVKGTAARAKRRKPVARVQERIANRRQDFAHQQSRKIVNHHQVIAVEALSVNRMVHTHCLAKSISDAAWSQFARLLKEKAESAARSFVAVNPAYTSQDCSRCGHRQKHPEGLRLSEREYRCPCCGLVLGRDHNASLNILRLGLQSFGGEP